MQWNKVTTRHACALDRALRDSKALKTSCLCLCEAIVLCQKLKTSLFTPDVKTNKNSCNLHSAFNLLILITLFWLGYGNVVKQVIINYHR